MVFFTADLHLFHANIIKYCRRPFSSVDEMNDTIIRNWNRVVGPHDYVYNIGDFGFFRTKQQLGEILDALNGYKLFLQGNHDKKVASLGLRFEGGNLIKTKVEGQEIVLCHYAMRVWENSHHGSWHLYGHSHGTLPELLNSLSFDVGVDCWNFTPISFEQVKEIMTIKTKRIKECKK